MGGREEDTVSEINGAAFASEIPYGIIDAAKNITVKKVNKSISFFFILSSNDIFESIFSLKIEMHSSKKEKYNHLLFTL